MGAPAPLGSHALDLQTTPQEAAQFVGPGAALVGSTVSTLHPSTTPSGIRRALVRLGSRSVHVLAGARSSAPLRAIPLLI
jgi:hypothetical protein